ncbi:MAG: hypothetical protein VW270_01065 [Candidatus Poseidoniales archaeon]
MSEEWNEVDLNPAPAEKEKVEFEVEGQEENEPVAVAPEPVQIETEPEPEPDTQPAQDAEEGFEPAEAQTDSELKGIETKGAQKRIRQLVQQRKEREEQVAALQREKEELQKKLREQEKDIASSLKKSIDSNEQFLQNKIEYAKRAYQRAADEGNSAEMLEAQEAMTQAYAEMTGVNSSKDSWERYNSEIERQLQEAEQFQQEQVQQQQPQYDPRAVEWAGQNEWFGSDNVMTAAALALDYELKNEGFDPSDDEFYGEIDRRMREQFPHKFQAAPVEEQPAVRKSSASNSTQVVAGASRTPASPSSGKKVKLTQEDIRLANKWGIPLERYAEEKLKAERSSGEYTAIG